MGARGSKSDGWVASSKQYTKSQISNQIQQMLGQRKKTATQIRKMLDGSIRSSIAADGKCVKALLAQ